MDTKYRKKPIIIDAWPFIAGDNKSWCCPVTGVGVVNFSEPVAEGQACSVITGKYWIRTLEGPFIVSEGDYIIRGVKGEYYPCKPDIFEATYERA